MNLQTVEVTQEKVEKILKTYNTLDQTESNQASCATGIRFTLSMLGVSIEGIENDWLPKSKEVRL